MYRVSISLLPSKPPHASTTLPENAIRPADVARATIPATLGARRERVDERLAAADGEQTRLRLGQELRRQKVEAHAELLEPGDRRAGTIGESLDQIRIGEAERAGKGAPSLA